MSLYVLKDPVSGKYSKAPVWWKDASLGPLEKARIYQVKPAAERQARMNGMFLEVVEVRIEEV